MQNLREKLLKAGLVTADQAKQAEDRQKSQDVKRNRPAERPPDRAPERSFERPRRAESGPPHDARVESRIPKLPPLPGSREHQRLISKKQMELDRTIRELVTASQVPVDPGDQTFYFVTRKQRLRRLEMTPAQHERLEKGELAVVERPDPGQIEHALVPAEIADRLLQLSQKAVRFFNKPGAAVGFITDDELKERQVTEASLPPEGAGDAERGDAAGAGEGDVETAPGPEPEPGSGPSPGEQGEPGETGGAPA